MADCFGCWVDGEVSESIPADDRGFLFGDHVFETMLWDGRTIPLWHLHWARLERAGGVFGIDLPDQAKIRSEIESLISGIAKVLRLTFSRGSSSTGYWIPQEINTRWVLQSRPLPMGLQQEFELGLRVHTSSMMLPPPGPWMGMKHGNRMLQVMLAREAAKAGLQEALIYRANGELAEGISSNVMIFDGMRLATPSCPEVRGVGLAWLKSKGVEIDERSVHQDEVTSAEEVIFMNAVSGPRPLIELDGQPKRVGPQVRALQALWQEAVSQ